MENRTRRGRPARTMAGVSEEIDDRDAPPVPQVLRQGWTVAPAAPNDPEAAAVLRDYLAELIVRYSGRATDDAEIDRHLRAGHDSDDLVPPTGALFLARQGGDVVGCVGLRRLGGEGGDGGGGAGSALELTRMFVRKEARGQGGASLLLAEAERAARRLGAPVIRLNTRTDLVEARALYANHGYAEIPPYGDDPYAQHWFEKRLDGAAGAAGGDRG